MVNQRIAELLSKAKDPERVFPATDLYNEGWMLRLVIDWFSRNTQVDCDIRFLKDSRWYSEALLPSQFLARQRGDGGQGAARWMAYCGTTRKEGVPT